MQVSSKSMFLKGRFFLCSTQTLCFVSDCDTCSSTAGCQGKREEEKAQVKRRLRKRKRKKERREGRRGEERTGKGRREEAREAEQMEAKRERPTIIVLDFI